MIGLLQEAVAFMVSAGQQALAVGAFALSVLSWGARFHPAVKWPLTEAAILVFGAALAVASWNASAVRHDRGAELKRAQRDLKRWQEAAAKQAEQRAEYEAIADRQRALAMSRAEDLQKMQETVDDYAEALAAGNGVPCPADDAYSRAMRSIRIHRDPPAETAPGGNRP